VAFELLAGTRPFHADTIAGMAHAIVYGTRPSARAANPELPEGIDKVLERGLAKRPEERFPTCAEFVAALEGALTSVPAPPPIPAPSPLPTPPPIPVPPPKGRARRPDLYLAGGLLLALCAAGTYAILMNRPAHLPVDSSKSKTQEITPPPAAPVVAQFTAEPTSIKSASINGASSTTLRWNVSGAERVAIDPGIGAVAASDEVKVKPTATTIYSLTATGPGGTTTKQVQVTVDTGVPSAAIYAQALIEKRAGHLERAVALFRQAANLGETRAMIELGNMSADGEGTPKNYTQAVHWYRLAADRGNSTGMVLLGGMYYLGKGVSADFTSSAYWFGKASDAGDPGGKYDLGMLYENGSGVTRDPGKAIQLYRDAAKLGNAEAKKRIVELLSGH
jgi:TPR repeat protein